MRRLADRARWAGKRLHDAVVGARRGILGVSGIGVIDAAVWINSLTWGMVAVGVSLLLFQFLSEDRP
ncbi:hypothetical protein [Amycolatopsis sp. WQ 127309]|uniref:hypothetical protein n=1 Tax=Amycolatopsis sp. WQ 127309 TaxID=2932773 RepID=UPI001FF42D88|nr:hypothetical protein [Amycolatopsis sp. WQ 127309]UOZ10533.1 hypothetical protein MUY22_20620 [Amycolatopsis sp. WQ 127309]